MSTQKMDFTDLKFINTKPRCFKLDGAYKDIPITKSKPRYLKATTALEKAFEKQYLEQCKKQ